ncbi:hypothetical protein L6R52_13335 [Myxococcota bacterium]|nr:hypothetical protein [Myxococcota bacterium]
MTKLALAHLRSAHRSAFLVAHKRLRARSTAGVSAEDVAQEVVVRLLERESESPVANPSWFGAQVARHLVTDVQRHLAVRARTCDELGRHTDAPYPEARGDHSQNLALAREALALVLDASTARDWQAAVGVALGGTAVEVARRLGSDERSVYRAVYRVRNLARAALSQNASHHRVSGDGEE